MTALLRSSALLLLLSSLLRLSAVGQPAPLDSDHLASVADSIARAALAGDLPGAPPVMGLAIGIAQDGEPMHVQGYGYASAARQTPISSSTVFRIGSITKPFTAAAVLQLVEEGQLSLDDDIRQHLPGAPTNGQRVTVRQLLNHTSGIPSYTSRSDWLQRSGDAMTPQQMVEYIQADSMDFAPGAEFRYNNSGYYLLGLLIEEITGSTYADHLHETLLEPLGLSDTGYCPDEPAQPRHAQGYASAGNPPQPALPISMSQPFAAGALCSSAADVLAFSHALTSGQVLSDEMMAEMTSPTVTTSGDTASYGLGLVRGDRSGHSVLGHSGGIHGFVSQWVHFPDAGSSVVVLTNTEGRAAPEVEAALSRHLLDLAQPERRDLALSPEEREVYLGTYDIGILRIRIFEQDDHLMAQATNQPPFRLRAQGDHEFHTDADPRLRLVFQVDNRQASQLTLHQLGQAFTGPRLTDAEIDAPEEHHTPLSVSEAQRYTGTYELGPLQISIFLDDEQLMGQVAGQPAFPLRYRGDHQFGADFDATLKLTFDVNAEGRAHHLTLEQQGRTFSGNVQ